jgi:hypothetical protein
MQPLGLQDRVFYPRWILANGWSEAGGLGTLFVLGREAAPALEKANDARTIGAGLASQPPSRFASYAESGDSRWAVYTGDSWCE